MNNSNKANANTNQRGFFSFFFLLWLFKYYIRLIVKEEKK
jgi:hypothetical protein